MGMPSFLTQRDYSVLFNEDGELIFYVPEVYFTDTKLPLADIRGEYVNVMGVIDWALVLPNGKVSEAKRFYFPSIFTCKPSRIEKVKELSLNKRKAIDYRILHFKKNDEVISNINIPQDVSNAELLLKSFTVNGGKIPPSVPYNKMQDYIVDSLRINGNDYGIGKQLFGIIVSEVCRDTKDLSKPYRLTDMKDQYSYTQIPMSAVAKYINPYVAFTSENFDESVMASILLSQDSSTDKIETPLEKILMA